MFLPIYETRRLIRLIYEEEMDEIRRKENLYLMVVSISGQENDCE